MDFTAIPIRDPYKVAHPESIVLLADPNTIRLCVVIEVIVVIVVFFLSAYYSATTGTTETKITFELISGYDCGLLAPRKDIEEMVSATSELAAFSTPRYTYDECMIALGPSGYDLCADDHRTDYFLSTTGVDVNDANCWEIFLTDNYRFCRTKEIDSELDQQNLNSIFSTSTSDSSYQPIMKDTSYFFSNGTGSFDIITTTFRTQTTTPESNVFGSDFVVGSNNNLFVIATPSSGANTQIGLYHMAPSSSSSELLQTLTAPQGGVHGIAYGASAVYIYYISVNKKGTIIKYNTTTHAFTEASSAVDCSSYITDANNLGGGYGYRYLSFGTDGMLYAMCITATSAYKASISAPPSAAVDLLPVIQVDPYTLTTTKVLYARIAPFTDSASGDNVTDVSQVLQVGSAGKLFFLANKPGNLLIEGNTNQVSSVSGGSLLQNLVSRGSFSGSYGVAQTSNILYFASGTRSYFKVTEGSFAAYEAQFLGQQYTANRLHVGLSYQICDGDYSNYSVDISSSTSFFKKCNAYNGIYYQVTAHYDVPSSCKEFTNSSSYAADLYDCPAVATLRQTFVNDMCSVSYSKVCEAVYTDNPPFSCETTIYPTWLTVIATAFANASGAWSIAFLVIKIILRQTHFHFVHDFEYSRKSERYLNRNNARVHDKGDFIAGSSNPEDDGKANNGSDLRARWKGDLIAESRPEGDKNGMELVYPESQPQRSDPYGGMENGQYRESNYSGYTR